MVFQMICSILGRKLFDSSIQSVVFENMVVCITLMQRLGVILLFEKKKTIEDWVPMQGRKEEELFI